MAIITQILKFKSKKLYNINYFVLIDYCIIRIVEYMSFKLKVPINMGKRPLRKIYYVPSTTLYIHFQDSTNLDRAKTEEPPSPIACLASSFFA